MPDDIDQEDGNGGMRPCKRLDLSHGCARNCAGRAVLVENRGIRLEGLLEFFSPFNHLNRGYFARRYLLSPGSESAHAAHES